MGIERFVYRTKTYIAGDWTGDKVAIDQIHRWNENDRYSLHFKDVHDYTQSYDSSHYCSIKKSLKKRMDISKKFVLVVGEKTNTLTKGACFNCLFYRRFLTISPRCSLGYSISNQSYIKYECEQAVMANIPIVVLYNNVNVDKNKCPESVKYKGTHKSMLKRSYNGDIVWDYQTVKSALMV